MKKNNFTLSKAMPILLSLFLLFGNMSTAWQVFADEGANEDADVAAAAEQSEPAQEATAAEVAQPEPAAEPEAAAAAVEDSTSDDTANQAAVEESASESEDVASAQAESNEADKSDAADGSSAAGEATRAESQDQAQNDSSDTTGDEAVNDGSDDDSDKSSEDELNEEDEDSKDEEDKDKEEEEEDNKPLAAIYIKPNGGKDDNKGSQEEPVASFEQAKKLQAENPNIKVIYVAGTIQAEGKMSLPSGVVLKRAPGYSGNLINVPASKTLTLSNITIDGDASQTDSSSIIAVRGDLTINAGTILQNNKKTSSWYSAGGAVNVYQGGCLTMNGGLVQNCQAEFGGGVSIFGTFVMNGGTIQNNTSRNDGYIREAASGGGVGIGNKGVMYFNGGSIAGNYASNDGGAIALGDYYTRYIENGTPRLFMAGGTIADNIAGGNGGGIFLQINTQARVSGGVITRNTAQALTVTSMFSGGGIYVNGGYENSRPSYTDGKLELVNPIIKNNTANGQGGGIANCPAGGYVVQVNNGGAIFDNKAKAGAEPGDLYVQSGLVVGGGSYHSGYPKTYISSHMLGGGDYNWRDVSSDEPFALLDREFRVGIDTPEYNVRLYATISDEEKQAAEMKVQKEGGVWITENNGRRNGGGVGSNGKVYIGTADTFSGNLKVSKVVESSDAADKDKEFNFKVTLDQYLKDGTYGDLEFVNSVATFTLKNGQSVTATGLPDAAKYTVEEEVDDAFVTVSEGETGQFMEHGATYEAKFTNVKKEVKFTKVWEGEAFTDEIKVRVSWDIPENIYKNRKDYDEVYDSEADTEPIEGEEEIDNDKIEELDLPVTDNDEPKEDATDEVDSEVKEETEQEAEYILTEEDDKVVLEFTIKKSEDWIKIIAGLDIPDDAVVDEVTDISSWGTVKIEGNSTDGYVITNTKNPPEEPENPPENPPEEPENPPEEPPVVPETPGPEEPPKEEPPAPSVPSTPGEPETPPAVPSTPGNPVTPKTPELPKTPQTPDVPKISVPSTTVSQPKTGDMTNIAVWVVLIAMAATVAAVVRKKFGDK